MHGAGRREQRSRRGARPSRAGVGRAVGTRSTAPRAPTQPRRPVGPAARGLLPTRTAADSIACIRRATGFEWSVRVFSAEGKRRRIARGRFHYRGTLTCAPAHRENQGTQTGQQHLPRAAPHSPTSPQTLRLPETEATEVKAIRRRTAHHARHRARPACTGLVQAGSPSRRRCTADRRRSRGRLAVKPAAVAARRRACLGSGGRGQPCTAARRTRWWSIKSVIHRFRRVHQSTSSPSSFTFFATFDPW